MLDSTIKSTSPRKFEKMIVSDYYVYLLLYNFTDNFVYYMHINIPNSCKPTDKLQCMYAQYVDKILKLMSIM